MTRRTVVVALVGLVLVAAVTACGGSSTKLYDAKAILKCIRVRPEFRPGGARATGIGAAHGLTLTTVGPKRFNYYLDDGYDVHGVWGYQVLVRWNPSGRGYLGNFFDTALIIFDTVKEERTMYRRLANSSFLRADLKNTTIRRNVFVSWGIERIPKAPRSIILGCLRTA